MNPELKAKLMPFKNECTKHKHAVLSALVRECREMLEDSHGFLGYDCKVNIEVIYADGQAKSMAVWKKQVSGNNKASLHSPRSYNDARVEEP